ncbi:hypothetical protein Tco_0861351 [Tanacetum coccineum]|uniref:Reverse transcriptase domain-containing protein n=1 Tax=Tanacetum coccineum TaxID=301880 RepID=A0ABQ5BLN4_9ASTR
MLLSYLILVPILSLCATALEFPSGYHAIYLRSLLCMSNCVTGDNWLNTILRGCTIQSPKPPIQRNFNAENMVVFDAIIGIDWLAKYQAIIVCAEKIVHIPWGNETLIVHRDESNRGHEARLHIISYSKTQEYMLKGCPVFLAHVTTNELKPKSEKKRLEDYQ